MSRRFILVALFENKASRFLFTGLINTIFGYAIYAVLIYLGLPYLVGLLISTILGVTFNFFSLSRIVFRGRRNWFLFGKFIVAYALTYLFNGCALIILTKEFLLNPYLGQALCIPLSVILSWVLLNHWVYKYN